MQFFRRVLLPVLVCAMTLVAQRKSRISAAVDDRVVVRIPGTTHRLVRNAQDLGRVGSDLPLGRMQMMLTSSPEQLAALAQLLRDQQDPSSPRYHQWLTPLEFGEQFGPTQDEIDSVTGWLRASGFRINRVAHGRRIIEFSGTTGLIESAFHAEMHRYAVNGETHIANSTDVSVPAALAEVVGGVVSLHDFRARPQHRAVLRGGSGGRLSPDYTDSSGFHALAPYDFAQIYDVTPVWTTLKVDGTGQQIAVISRSNIDTTDINTFRSTYGLPPASVQIVLNGPDPGILTGSGDDVEVALDTEWSGAVAPGATSVVVVSASTRVSDGVDLSATYAVDNNVAQVLTYSFSTCEASLATGNGFYNSLWQQAVAQGTSVFVSSGDDGSAGCDEPDSSQPARQGFAVSGLASTPYNVAVGGTEFNENGSVTSYWSSTNASPQVSSVMSYIPEVVWNESVYLNPRNPGNGLWASSGGVSIVYQTPPWQTGPGVPASDPGTTNQHHRYLPDVSLTAASHDGYLVQSGGVTYLTSGTSASAPSFAGIMALINQYTNTHNGLPNPRLYALAQSNPAVFHDVISGNNGVPCSTSAFSSSAACTGAPIAAGIGTMGGYSAGPGYDLATGLGSVDVYQLVTNWSAAASGNSGGTGGSGTSGGGTDGVNMGTVGTPPPAGVVSLSGAHVATGGGWKTLIELINPTGAPVTAHLRIYDDNGNTLAIPLVSTDKTINTTASALDPPIAAHAVLILTSAASGALVQGSAEVTSGGAISGFMIFQTPAGQEVLVPLSSGAASVYSVPFDNTGGLSTGIALANSSVQAAVVSIIALDQNGGNVGTSTVTVAGLGHQSFVAASQIPSLANRRGVLQFAPPNGAQISVVGIRSDASGVFTGIPLLASATTGGGTLADLASGAGWTTLIELVNSSSNSSHAHVSFYGDDGSALSLPIISTDLGLNQTASFVDATLPGGGSVLIQSTGDAVTALQGGSALLTAAPGVAGFLIFKTPAGQNVLVPMQSGSASNYLVAFDQTNGLATGIAISNAGTSPANISVYLRDQNGASLGSAVTVNVPPQGHQSFGLTDLLPLATGKYGTVQFVPAPGQSIGVVGIRATPTGAFTSIPVLTP